MPPPIHWPAIFLEANTGVSEQPRIRKGRGGRDLLWMISGNLCQAFSQWGFIVCATKLVGVAGAGRYAYANAVCTQVVLLTGLNLRSLQGSDSLHKFPFSAYFTLRAITVGISFAITAALAWFHKSSPELLWLMIFVGLTRLIESLIETSYGQMQRLENVAAVGRSLLLRGVLSFVGFWMVLDHTGSLALAAAASAVCTLFILLLHDFRLIRHEEFLTSDRVQLRRLFYQARSLGFTSFLSALQVNFPRYLLRATLGEAALGIYAAAAQLPLSAAIFVRSMGDAALPRLAHWYQVEGRTSHPPVLYRMLAGTTLLFLAGAALALIGGSQILRTLYTPQHGDYVTLLLILIMAEFFAQFTAVLGGAATASRRLRLQPAIVCISLVCVCSVGLVATHSQGLLGMAGAVAAANLLMLLGYLLLLAGSASK